VTQKLILNKTIKKCKKFAYQKELFANYLLHKHQIYNPIYLRETLEKGTQ
jgi:hypothetical protein